MIPRRRLSGSELANWPSIPKSPHVEELSGLFSESEEALSLSALKLVHQTKKLGSRDRPLGPKGGPRRGDPAVERGVGGVVANNLKPKRRFQNFTL